MTNLVELKQPEPKSPKNVIDIIREHLELARKTRIVASVTISIEESGRSHLCIQTPETDNQMDALFDTLKHTFEYLLSLQKKGGD